MSRPDKNGSLRPEEELPGGRGGSREELTVVVYRAVVTVVGWPPGATEGRTWNGKTIIPTLSKAKSFLSTLYKKFSLLL